MLQFIAVIVVIGFLVILTSKFLPKATQTQTNNQVERPAQRTNNNVNRNEEIQNNVQQPIQQNIDDNADVADVMVEENAGNNQIHNPQEVKKLTKKEALKQEKKKMKEDNREQLRQQLEYKKIREQEKEKEYQEKERKRLEQQQKEEELFNKLKLEQQIKEEEIFKSWKDNFKVQESGEDTLDFTKENLIEEFLNYIKLRKVVSLEDLSGEFKIPSNDLVDRLKSFEEQGRICGIIDDRGKYIYLTDKELNMIEKLFINRGRISKTDLIKECNKIIRFVPTDEDKIKIQEEQNKIFQKYTQELENNEKTSKA